MLEIDGIVRVATTVDASNILALREALTDWMVGRGIGQWFPDEYSQDRLGQEIDRREWFVLDRDATILAAVRISWADPSTWPAAADAGYIHGLMVSRAMTGGMGSRLLRWGEEHVQQTGHSLARLDCVASNSGLRAYYARQGYREAGTVDFGAGSSWHPVTRFEKSLP